VLGLVLHLYGLGGVPDLPPPQHSGDNQDLNGREDQKPPTKSSYCTEMELDV
jgi:hypothetical protein